MNEKDTVKGILENYKTVAVVGLSRDPSKDSYTVAEFLKSRGWSIIPVNPFEDEVLGKKMLQVTFRLARRPAENR